MSLRRKVSVDESSGQSDEMKPEEGKISENVEEASVVLVPRESSIFVLEEPPTQIGIVSLIGLGIVALQVSLEVSKQISNYSMQYYNGGKYLVASTAMVFTSEIIKMIFTVLRMGSFPHIDYQILQDSVKYIVPSVMYAINNNIYFYGLTLVPPPIWLILCSMRTLVTAFIYRAFLKRQLTHWQYVGIGCIVSSLMIAKIPDVLFYSVNKVPLIAIVLALIASCISAMASIYTELLFKTPTKEYAGNDSFLVKQFWLYSYGGLVSLILHFVSNPTYTLDNFIMDICKMSPFSLACFLVALTCTSVGGITVASILKYLDNIVKEYTGSFANVITAILSSLLFPDRFQFTVYIVLSLISLVTGILLYETKKANPSK
uniref:ZK370.7 n=1 Tax=Caligus clemensi TaxID=344056 RepID=C1C371_CALCM|nr:ZK370.7 [Caligus clemensi]